MKNYRDSAFTLLEIMLAITILAMVATAVYATWSAGLAGWKRSATIMESLQRERIVMETLTELTQSAVFFTSKDSLYEVQGTREAQTGDSISFVTTSDLLLPQTESMAGAMRRVTISLSRDDHGRPFLGIANAPALQPEKAPETVTHILSADVCGFAVRYRNPVSVSWDEEWGEASLIPSAVEYTVAFGSNDGRTPPVVVTRTVELSTARYAMLLAGQGNVSQRDTTNTVTRRDIDLSTPTETSGGDIPGGMVITPATRQQQGVAMIVVMWVIMVLSLLISGFAFRMHVETKIASFSRKELKAQMLARSGIEVARMELILDTKSPTDAGFDSLVQEWATNEILYVNHELGDGKYNVKIIDEERKLPINTLSKVQLKRLVDVLGIDPSDGDVIVDSILDWIDEDDLHLLNGAEDDYYGELDPPYRAKNGPLDRIEELLLVRGVTKEIFDGTPGTEDEPGHPGLKQLLTTTSTGQLNVNTASSEALQTMLGLDETQVAAILTRRDGVDDEPGTDDDLPFRSVDEFLGAVGSVDANANQQLRQLLTVSSNFFRVESTGEWGGVKHTINAVLLRQGNDCLVVSWNESRGGS